jgi:5'-nucleotidase
MPSPASRLWRTMFGTPSAAAVSVLALLLVASLSATLILQGRRADASSIVSVTILQMNDVYEIMPLGGSGQGGLARVAALRRQLLEENPNTYTVLAGDLLSPSALSSARVGAAREALNGRQMVDVMNHLGLDYATLGNHEFDLGKADFDRRIQESSFQWLSANAFAADGTPFPGVRPNAVITASNRAGRRLRIGLFGLTIDSNRKDYVRYADTIDAARAQVEALADTADIVIALTHLSLLQDEALALALPDLALIIGGHEHENVEARRGPRFVPVVKADANAKSVYVHRLRYDADTGHLDIDSQLRTITPEIPGDPGVEALVRRWRDEAFQAFAADGLDPERTVATLATELDGREGTVRSGRTNLTHLIAQAMMDAFPGAEAAIFNSGSIRLDDTLPPGPMTQYDVLRVLPFPGDLQLVRISGAMLQRIMDVGRDEQHVNTGGYLQTAGIEPAGGGASAWIVGGQPLDDRRSYRVVMNNYLLEGREAGLDFIGRHGSDIVVTPEPARELRRAVIDRLERHGGT